jgi:hypothetical protein
MNVPMARTVDSKLTVMGVPLEHQLLRLQTSSSGHSSPFTHLSSQDLSTATRTAYYYYCYYYYATLLRKHKR